MALRLGVSAKVFTAYAVLLLAFAGNASFTLVTVVRPRARWITVSEPFWIRNGNRPALVRPTTFSSAT